MHILIEKLKISNFLSFLGEYEVNLKPFTAVMCNFYEGKHDLLRAFEFVFGARISDLKVKNPLDLVHKVLREEFLVNRNIHTYVEITFSILHEKKQLKFCRSIKKGVYNLRIEHKVSDLVTSSLQYEEKLISLGIYIRQKNLIFYKSYFNNVIWGSPEDLEMTICTCLRESCLLEDWKKANKEVEYLKQLKNRTAEKNYNSMKKSHSVIEKYTEKYENFLTTQETNAKKVLLDVMSDSSSENTSSPIQFTEEISVEDIEKKRLDTLSLEMNILLLTKKLDDLKLKEAFLTSYLHHEEIKLAVKPVNASVLQNRISHLKTIIQEKENQMSEIWEKIQAIKFELENLTQKISFELISLQMIQITSYRQNRFTQYGRFYDFLHPSRYVQLLKQIIGANIFYAHLCDSVEEAFTLLGQLKELKYEHREAFLPFENYSCKLKDIIIASGERGIQINTLEELLIFLCKLKHYEFIDEVPVIVQRDFEFENILPDGYTIYIRNNIHFTSEGLINYKTEQNDFSLETEKKLYENLTQLCIREEMNYRKWDDLLFMKLETLVDMNSLENDVFCLKQKWRKSIQKPHIVPKHLPEMESMLKFVEIRLGVFSNIKDQDTKEKVKKEKCRDLVEAYMKLKFYEEYVNIFKEHTEEREKSEKELQQEEPFFAERNSSDSSNEESLNLIMKELEEVLEEKTKIQAELKDLTNELRQLNVIPLYGYNVRKNFIKFENNLNKAKFFFEKEYKKLKNFMKKNDLEDFLGNQEWRKTFITSLIKDFDEIKKKFKASSEEFLNIATARKTKLYQLFDHCSRFLSNTFRPILNDTLPFVKINFDPEEEKIQIMSCLGEEKVNVVDIKHFNTLLKFTSAFSVFLEIAKFDKIPFIIIDDIEEYFPIFSDNLEAVLEISVLEKILPDSENPRFDLLMRLGQFLKHFIKKNTPGTFIRKNGNNKDYTNGPVQIIYFAREDFAHAAEHCIWIQNKVLPEEYLSENCNAYSEIHEINYNTNY